MTSHGTEIWLADRLWDLQRDYEKHASREEAHAWRAAITAVRVQGGAVVAVAAPAPTAWLAASLNAQAGACGLLLADGLHDVRWPWPDIKPSRAVNFLRDAATLLSATSVIGTTRLIQKVKATPGTPAGFYPNHGQCAQLLNCICDGGCGFIEWPGRCIEHWHGENRVYRFWTALHAANPMTPRWLQAQGDQLELSPLY